MERFCYSAMVVMSIQATTAFLYLKKVKKMPRTFDGGVLSASRLTDMTVTIPRRFIFIFVLAAIFIAALVFFELRFQPTSLIYYTLGWTILVLLLLWGGNRLITKLLTRFLPWTEYGNIRFFTQLFLGIVVSL